jgi:hypothetical protein
MNVPVEIIAVVVTAMMAMQGWLLASVVAIKTDVARIKQQIQDKK